MSNPALKRYKIMLKMFLTISVFKKSDYLRKTKLFKQFGEKSLYYSHTIPSEPELVSIGNNVHICANVRFITHDVINYMLVNCPEYSNIKAKNYVGEIKILDNCVIGADATLMYDTTIGSKRNNCCRCSSNKGCPPRGNMGRCTCRKNRTTVIWQKEELPPANNF